MRPARHPTLLYAVALVAAGALALGADVPRSGTRYPVTSQRPLFRGYEPAELRDRLAAPDSVDIARACGNIAWPWAYRGLLGRENSMRSYGRHGADSLRARAMAAYLLRSATVDSSYKVPPTQLSCEPAQAKPVYLMSFHGRGKDTIALLRFDLGAVLFFDAEEPLGMTKMGADGDSLWAALGEVLDDDPLLRAERPRPPADSVDRLRREINADVLPEALKKVHPSYTNVARELNLSGQVMVEALVGADGAIHDAFVVSGHPVFRDDALEAVWQWHFKPASYKGEPVAVWVTIPVSFSMP